MSEKSQLNANLGSVKTKGREFDPPCTHQYSQGLNRSNPPNTRHTGENWSPVAKKSQKRHLLEPPMEVPLTKGKVALVSPCDYARVNQYKWRAKKDGNVWYAFRDIPPNLSSTGRKKQQAMHRFILGPKPNELVDHENSDGLTNTRGNIRIATHAQNARNVRKPKHGVTSRYKGVSWHRTAKKYQATIRVKSKNIYLGLFDSDFLAAKRYDFAAKEYHGAFARLNFPISRGAAA
jgi:hypothetical protein